MTLIKKSVLILTLYYALMLLQACNDCEDSIVPYYDYSSISIKSNAKTISGNYFEIEVLPENLVFIAQNLSDFRFINSALATPSCDSDGEDEKYAITNINIYSDTTFKDTILIGQSISSLFEMMAFDGDYVSFENHSFYNLFENGNTIHIRTKAVPISKNKEYRFTIEIVKENGDIVSAVSQPAIWQ